MPSLALTTRKRQSIQQRLHPSTSLPDSELKTLLSMALACQSLADAKDAISLFALLDERLKPQLKQKLKSLPIATKKLLRDAATSQSIEGGA